MKSLSIRLVFVLAVLVVLNAAAVAQKNRYTLYSLGFSGSINGVHQPVGVSSNGVVVGYNDKTKTAFTWSKGVLGALSPLGLFSPAQATSISENGTWVGAGSANGAILIKPSAGAYYVGYTNDLALGVNDSGQEVGQQPSYANSQQPVAFYADITHGIGDGALGSFGGGSVATAINNNGLIVGYSATTSNTTSYTRAFHMTYGGTMTDFNPYSIVYDSSAYAVNDLGTIVGTSNQASCIVFPPFNFVHACRGPYSYPVIFSTNGTTTQIGNLGGNGGAALAVNNAGDIVGWNLTASGDRHAFLYTGGQTYDINALMPAISKTWTITEASAINDNGMIVVHATSLLYGESIIVLVP